jgi:glucose/arabinose dehydrogenase
MRIMKRALTIGCGSVLTAVGCGKTPSGSAEREGGSSVTAPDGGGDGLAGATAGDASSGRIPDASATADVSVPTEAASPLSKCSGAVHSTSTAGTVPAAPALTVPSGFTLQAVASVPSARELAALPNGDLLVATSGGTVYIVPNADSAGAAGAALTFATIPDTPAQGIAFDARTCTVYVSSQHDIYSMAYADGQVSAAPGQPIAEVRTGQVAPMSDGDVHTTTSIAVAGGSVFAGVGSSCNACIEVDPTRATVQQMNPDGSGRATRATRIRNAIALAENPATGTLWAGGAGQDDLVEDHPYEFFDAVTSHPGVADYGWPDCEEDHVAYTQQGASCAGTVAPIIELPAYSTIIGAVFYPAVPSGAHAFPQKYRGSLFLTAHGSWHQNGAVFVSAPLVALVPMNGDAPATPVNWNDPTVQWATFVGGFQNPAGTARVARPTGITVGALGSLFIADDQNGLVYRVRPM